MSDPDWLYLHLVFSSPDDYPGKYVVRMNRVRRGSAEVEVSAAPTVVVDSLEAARAALPPGLHRLDRFLEDIPSLVEVWL